MESSRQRMKSVTVLAVGMSPDSTGEAKRLPLFKLLVSRATSPSIKGLIRFGSRSEAPCQGNAPCPSFWPFLPLPGHSFRRLSRASSALLCQ